jgi:ribosomal protein S18 acetylase RimI-like enzyme
MTLPIECYIRLASSDCPTDEELEQLLRRAYVDGGFTAEDVAKDMLSATAVRRRGELLVAIEHSTNQFMGTVTLVPAGAKALKIATGDTEGELHLLAVLPERRNHGIGRKLVAAALERARRARLARVILWTQPTMHAALRLYAAAGFIRCPERDFCKEGRDFLVMQVDLGK